MSITVNGPGTYCSTPRAWASSSVREPVARGIAWRPKPVDHTSARAERSVSARTRSSATARSAAAWTSAPVRTMAVAASRPVASTRAALVFHDPMSTPA